MEAFAHWAKSRSGVVSVVTGAGKTVLAHMCISFLHAEAPATRVIVIVPTEALLDQWYVSLLEDLRVPEGDIALYSGAHRPPEPRPVCLMVLNTARRVAPEIAALGPNFLIVDECHRAGSPKNGLALKGKHVAALGLSATPSRDYDDGFESLVRPHLGEVIYEYGHQDALRDGVIVSFNLVNVQVPMTRIEFEKYSQLTRRLAVYLRSTAGAAINDERAKRILLQRASVTASATARVPTTVRIVEDHKGERCIVFHERIQSADHIASVLKKRGCRCATYHTRIGQTLRRENLRLFRRGVFDCLVTCRALDEGANVPEASVAVVASATRSRRQRLQRMGRVLRPAIGKSAATIYTLYATEAEERGLRDEIGRLKDVASSTWLTVTTGGKRP